jgi:hypothetical protein
MTQTARNICIIIAFKDHAFTQATIRLIMEMPEIMILLSANIKRYHE